MTTTGRRVLHVAPFLWSGAGEVITSLCESQALNGPVAIATAGSSRGLRDWHAYRRRLVGAGVRHWRIDLFDRSPETFWRSVPALREIISEWRPHVVHTHAGVPALAAAAARRDHEFAIVSHVYSWGIDRPVWMDEMDLAGLRQADVVVCSSRSYQRRLLAGGIASRRLVRLPWGLAPSKTATMSRPRRRGGAFPALGFVGRIEPRKGQLHLVRGFARVRARYPDATLELVGPVADGPYAREVERAIREAGLGGAVRLRGYVRSTWAAMSRWDLFVSVASDEGQGLAILEAMTVGVPVAARIVAGVEDYFKPDRDGAEIRSSKAGDVAEAVLQCLADGRRRQRIAARLAAVVRRRYSWERLVARIETIYSRVDKR